MLLKLIGDLRFIIGAFFAIISVILLLTGIFSPSGANAGMNLNLTAGEIMGLFSLFMLSLAWLHSERG